MNYLAHCYLADADPARADPEALVGGLMGDFLRGPLAEHGALSPTLRRAVALHRRIDSFTDAHPLFGRSRARLRPPYRRYGGILIDIFYDHFLARGWDRYADLPLACFCESVYTALQNHYHILPERMRPSVDYMLGHDLLQSYALVEGIGRSLRGVERRLSRPSALGRAVAELEYDYAGFEEDFTAFFPELVTFSRHTEHSLRHTHA